MRKYNLNFSTDYHQFYLFDKDSDGDTGSDTFWTQQAFANKLAIEDGVIGVGIENDEGIVNLMFCVLESANSEIDLAAYDHIVEGSLEIVSGILQIENCPDSIIIKRIKLEPGDYRIRAYSKNLDLAYSEQPEDIYKIEIWPEIFSDVTVVKRYSK